eukprot:1162143-Pelagomonas_calceolata.AAC.27
MRHTCSKVLDCSARCLSGWGDTGRGDPDIDWTLPTSIKKKETRWLKRAGGPLHHKAGTEGTRGQL